MKLDNLHMFAILTAYSILRIISLCSLIQICRRWIVHVEVIAVIGGGDVHVQRGVNGSNGAVGAFPPIICAFTSTGIAAPVLSPNS